MDKERITRLISFDDEGEDTSTGYVSVSDTTDDEKHIFHTPWGVLEFVKSQLKSGRKYVPGIKSVRKGLTSTTSRYIGRYPCIEIQYFSTGQYTQFCQIRLQDQDQFDFDWNELLKKLRFSTALPYSVWERLADLSGKIILDYDGYDFI